MDDDFITKLMTLGWWLPLIVLTFVVGLPLVHAVSLVDTACTQSAAMIKTGSSASEATAEALAVIQSEAPTQMDQTVLFDPTQDFLVTELGQGVQQVSVTYEFPIFAPLTHMLGLAGPTIPLTDIQTVTVNSAVFEGIPYTN
jgi:hypothetical protein